MKKVIFVLIIMIGLMPRLMVKADTVANVIKQDFTASSTFSTGCNKGTIGYTYNNFENWILDENNKAMFDDLYSNVIEMYNDSYSNYYYQSFVQIIYEDNNLNDLYAVIVGRKVNSTPANFDGNITGSQVRYLVAYYGNGTYYYDIDENRSGILNVFNYENNQDNLGYSCSNSKNNYIVNVWKDEYQPFTGAWNTIEAYNPTFLFESNLPSENENKVINEWTINITDSNNNILETYNQGTAYPVLYEEGYNPNNNVNLEEVELDNYLYVLLTLKNYEQKNEFQTNLQVKGQIGITPIYNYGQTSKDAITGVKVQDRCNVAYENYTTYPLYVLKQDLQNNVIYAVKKCSSNSSFKYNKNIFNITYITNENKDDPVVTINGKQYHTIPFEELPSTANKNEEENYIPGQSGAINDAGGLDGAIKSVQQKMGEIWDTFTYFTQFINQIFSVLPEELRIVLVSGFTIMIVLGLIKIFIN